MLEIFDSPLTGEAWLLQAGHDVVPYRFRGIPAPIAGGAKTGALDPTAIPTL